MKHFQIYGSPGLASHFYALYTYGLTAGQTIELRSIDQKTSCLRRVRSVNEWNEKCCLVDLY